MELNVYSVCLLNHWYPLMEMAFGNYAYSKVISKIQGQGSEREPMGNGQSKHVELGSLGQLKPRRFWLLFFFVSFISRVTFFLLSNLFLFFVISFFKSFSSFLCFNYFPIVFFSLNVKCVSFLLSFSLSLFLSSNTSKISFLNKWNVFFLLFLSHPSLFLSFKCLSFLRWMAGAFLSLFHSFVLSFFLFSFLLSSNVFLSQLLSSFLSFSNRFCLFIYLFVKCHSFL